MSRRISTFYHTGLENQSGSDATFDIRSVNVQTIRKWKKKERQKYLAWLYDCKIKLEDYINHQIELANLEPDTKFQSAES